MIWGKKKKTLKHPTGHSAAEAANEFLQLARNEGSGLDNMQLQKLVYIAFGFFAAILNARMFDDVIEAWSYGPVIPDLYFSLKKYGDGEVTEFLQTDKALDDESPERKVIDSVWNSYKQFTGPQLSRLTHKEGTPWSNTWKPGQKNIEIPFHEIRHHYEQLFKKST